MPLMLSPALVIKAAFERAPAPAVAPPRRRSAENGRGRQNGRVLKRREQQSIGRIDAKLRGDSIVICSSCCQLMLA